MSRPLAAGKLSALADSKFGTMLWMFCSDSRFQTNNYDAGGQNAFMWHSANLFPWAGCLTESSWIPGNFGQGSTQPQGTWGTGLPYGAGKASAIQRINTINQIDTNDGVTAAAVNTTGIWAGNELDTYKFNNVNTPVGSHVLDDLMFLNYFVYPNQQWHNTNLGGGLNLVIRPILPFWTTANGGDKINALRKMAFGTDGTYDTNNFYGTITRSLSNIYTGTSGSLNTIDYHANCDDNTSADLTTIVALPSTPVKPFFSYSVERNVAPGATFQAGLCSVLMLLQNTKGVIWMNYGCAGRTNADYLTTSVQSDANLAKTISMSSYGNPTMVWNQNYYNDMASATDTLHPNGPRITSKTMWKQYLNNFCDRMLAAGASTVCLVPDFEIANTSVMASSDDADTKLAIAQARPNEVLYLGLQDAFPGQNITAMSHNIANGVGGFTQYCADGTHPGTAGIVTQGMALHRCALEGFRRYTSDKTVLSTGG